MICQVCLVQAQKTSNVTLKGSKTISINAKTVMDIQCVSVFTILSVQNMFTLTSYAQVMQKMCTKTM
jgi:hypothetical protein